MQISKIETLIKCKSLTQNNPVEKRRIWEFVKIVVAVNSPFSLKLIANAITDWHMGVKEALMILTQKSHESSNVASAIFLI